MYYYGFDPTYILVLIGVFITMAAQAKMRGTFQRYSAVRSGSGMTGQEVARRILMANGIFDVAVEPVAGQLTDHYDPRKKVVKLSEVIYNSTSIAAVGVAAHECGHAIQDNRDYLPLRLRTAIVPIANLGSTLSFPMIPLLPTRPPLFFRIARHNSIRPSMYVRSSRQITESSLWR